jgi:hypothetical protein
MQFAQPLWLLAGLAACAFLFWRYRQFEIQQHKTLVRFASVRLLDKLTPPFLRFAGGRNSSSLF